MKLTASLLQSWDWWRTCPPNWKAGAYKQIVGMLNKEFTSNPALIRGQQYEDIINEALLNEKEVPPELECLRGCTQQKWIAPLDIAGVTFRGRLDYNNDDTIYDLKTTKSQFKEETYTNKWQHIIYMLAERKDKFEYKVACFDDEMGLKPHSIHTVEIKAHPSDYTRLENHILKFLDWLKENELWDLYKDVYNG